MTITINDNIELINGLKGKIIDIFYNSLSIKTKEMEEGESYHISFIKKVNNKPLKENESITLCNKEQYELLKGSLTLEEIEEKYFGKKGTVERDKWEKEKEELLKKDKKKRKRITKEQVWNSLIGDCIKRNG